MKMTGDAMTLENKISRNRKSVDEAERSSETAAAVTAAASAVAGSATGLVAGIERDRTSKKSVKRQESGESTASKNSNFSSLQQERVRERH